MTTAICAGCTVPAEMLDGINFNDEHGYLCTSCMQATVRTLAFSLHWHENVGNDPKLVDAFRIVIANLSQEFADAIAAREHMPPIRVRLTS